MGWLTGKELEHQVRLGRIVVEPFSSAQCAPNSYDYRLGPTLEVLQCNSTRAGQPCVDPRLPLVHQTIAIPPSGSLLQVDEAYLGWSLESFGSDVYAALTTGKSSVGRLFLKNHLFHLKLVPIGHHGRLRLNITVKLPTLVFAGMRIGQIFFFDVADAPGDAGPEGPSR